MSLPPGSPRVILDKYNNWLLPYNYICLPTNSLINRGLYPQAMEVCTYLKIPPGIGEVKVLRSWALRKVRIST